MIIQNREIILLLSLFIILFFLWGCEDNALAPEFEPEKDYIVYIWETDHAGNHFYMGYHPTGGKIDTFTADDGPTWSMEASADGKFLFVATRDYVAKIDLKTKETMATLPYRADYGIAVSADNQYLALMMGPGFVLVSASDFSVIYEDSLLDFRSCSFSHDSKKIYGYGNGSYHSVVKMDLENNYQLTSIELTPGSIIQAVLPSFDEKKYFLVWYYNMWFSRFEVYDVELDSIMFRDWLWAGCNYLELSPDGEYVFYTEAGNSSDVNGENYFTVYDINRNRIKMRISTVGIEDGINPTFMALGKMAFTPDGKWLVIGEARNRASFIRFNMITMQIDDYVKGEINMESYGGYTCQCGL